MVLRTTFPLTGHFKQWSYGFTLIETLVTVGIIGVLIVSVTGILGGFFKAKTSAETTGMVQAEAAKVMEKLKVNVLEAKGGINCFSGVGETAIVFETKNGDQTTLFCNQSANKIASQSAHGTYDLLGGGISIFDCSEFINCTTLPSTEISLINFKFSLGVTGSDLGVSSWTFESKVAARR